MIAIYVRQSVDRVDSISIESQVEFCKYEAKGAEFKLYSDRGFSGKNTNRPAFKELLADIESGKITRVIVYKLDRISRSILDFSRMMVKFDEHHVEFVSSTEKFDTSSPMGRAMLNICIVFAQLERETIQKRVADAYYARSQKSFYMGGRVPFGFRLESTMIDNIKTSRYIVNPEEAEQVKLIYEMYANLTTSYGDIIRYFQDNGLFKNGKPWQRSRIADILRNPIYVKADMDVYDFYLSQGAIVANSPEDFIGTNGCYYYKGKDAKGRKQVTLEGNHLVLAPHEGIVDSETWLKCRQKSLKNGQIRPYQKAKNTWLAGKIKCGVCGYALIDKRYGTRKGRYMLCSHKMNSKACDGPGTIYSDEFEALIFGLIKDKLAEFKSLSGKPQKQVNPELTALNVELAKVTAEIDSLMAKLSDTNETMFRYINNRVEELDSKKSEIETRIYELGKKKTVEVGQITNHVEMWEKLNFDDRREVVHQLINVIRVTSDKVIIDWKV